MLYDAKEIAFKIVPSNHFFWDCAVPKVHNNLLQDAIFYLQKVYIYRSTCYRAWFTQGAIWGADMGCYLRVDSHSYGKISPRPLKERPHNLTKWTFLGTFTRHFAILRWKIGGKNSGAANVCVCRFLAGVVSALAQWIDVLQINHHWCPDTWHMIST